MFEFRLHERSANDVGSAKGPPTFSSSAFLRSSRLSSREFSARVSHTAHGATVSDKVTHKGKSVLSSTKACES
jgi:hypothetical protein